jgi:hypothetical protein
MPAEWLICPARSQNESECFETSSSAGLSAHRPASVDTEFAVTLKNYSWMTKGSGFHLPVTASQPLPKSTLP